MYVLLLFLSTPLVYSLSLSPPLSLYFFPKILDKEVEIFVQKITTLFRVKNFGCRSILQKKKGK